MHADLEIIVQLQGVDMRATALRREIAALPKHIAAFEKELETHQKQLEATKARLGANLKERKQMDLDVQGHQQKISKLKDQMLSAKTNEQYRAFQNEIEFIEAAIRKCEDRVLQLMEDVEKLEGNVKSAEADLGREKAVVDKHKVTARQRTGEDEAKLAVLVEERKGLVARLSPGHLALYDKCVKKFNGQAVSEASGGRCQTCQLEIRLQLFQDLKKGERILVCENCGRILHYNPPVAFDTEGPGAAASPAKSSTSARPGKVSTGSGTRVDMS